MKSTVSAVVLAFLFLMICESVAGDYCSAPYYYPPPNGWASPPVSPYGPEYAPAVPAPPSGSPIMPLPRRPQVIESRSLYLTNSATPEPEIVPVVPVRYDTYKVAGDSEGSKNSQEASICFWNLTDRPLTLRANGRTYSLDKDQNVSVNLPRKFLWQVGGQDPVTTTLAADQQALEIVLRKPRPVASR